MKKKQAKSDFTKDQLPRTRVAVFFDCLKLHFVTFLRVGCNILLYFLPLFILGIVRDNLISDAVNNADIVAARATLLLFDALCIPLYLLAAVGVSGAIKVVRTLAWAEPLFYKSDFSEGIKTNFKLYAPLFVIIGTAVLLADFIMQASINPIIKGLSLGFFVVLLLPLAIFIAIQGAIYKIDFFNSFKNALYLFFKSVPTSVLTSVAVALPILFTLLPNTLLKHGCLIVYVILFLPFTLLACFLHCSRILDEYVNKYYHPEIVGKGMWYPDPDDTQE